MSDLQEQANWEATRVPVICNECDWRYLALSDQIPDRCPHCAAESLEVLEPGEADFPYAASPELVVPFTIPEVTISQRIQTFSDGIPLPPVDLDPSTLIERLRPMYFPVWLVDSDVQAQWQAEVGFDYQVVSHQDRYADSAGWQTNEVRETRVRWEPRVGHLSRHYDNVAAPALNTHQAVQRVLGSHDVASAQRSGSVSLGGVLVRAPDRAPDEAWSEATMGLRQRASQECRTAADADHLRSYRWSPTCTDIRWTLLLLPIYATYYLDDEDIPRQILVNGQTGQLTGVRRASPERAHRRSLTIGIIALVLFTLSLILGLVGMLIVPPLVVVAVLGALLSIMVGIAAIVPTARVTLFNRRQSTQLERI